MVHIAKIIKNPCNWYLALWSLYWLQGALYESGGFFSQSILLILLILSLKHACKVMHFSRKPLFFKGLGILLLMYTIYGLAIFVTDGWITNGRNFDVPSYIYLKGLYISLLPIWSCYYYTTKGLLSYRNLQIWVPVFLLVGIIGFYWNEQLMLNKFADMGSDREEITNNYGYTMLSIIPCMLIYNRKIILQIIGIGVCVFFIMVGMKRGAILDTLLSLIVFIWYKLRVTKGGKKLFFVLLFMLAFNIVEDHVKSFVMNSDYFVSRVEQTLEGNSSNRDIIYKQIIDDFNYNSNIMSQLFGKGANASIKVTGNYAHNDWLELLINQGILGIFVFLYFCICFIFSFRNKSLVRDSRFSVLFCFIIIIVQTFFSAGLTNMNIFIDCILGFGLADGFKDVKLNKSR